MLMDSNIEEMQRTKRLEKIQTYRLVRDKILEHQDERELNREIERCNLDCENVVVSESKTKASLLFLKRKRLNSHFPKSMNIHFHTSSIS